MTSAALVWHNFWRNKLRTALTVASVAASLFLFTLLQTVVRAMQAVAANSASQLRLVVHQKTTMTNLLPLGHGPKIAALPGVRAVCAVRWFGGRLENSAEQFPSLAADVDSLPTVYSDFELSPTELQDWLTERTAVIVGAGLAKRNGWTIGQRVTLRGGIPPYPTLEFRIVGVTAASAYSNLFALRLDYLLEALRHGAPMPPDYYDAVNFYWVKASSPAALEALGATIDDTFAHGPAVTRTEHEEAFVASFTKMFGDIPGIVSSVGVVVVVSVLLVVCNTMSMSIRERVGELGVLKSIGFPPRRLMTLVLSESVLLGLCGGLLGCGLALLAARYSRPWALNMPYFPVLSVALPTVLLSIGVGALIGLLAGVAPARSAARRPVTATLREEG